MASSRAVTRFRWVEPYLLDYRVALGLDFFQRQQLANNFHFVRHQDARLQPRLGFGLREDLSLQLRYSIYQQQIQLPANLANCNNNPANGLLALTRHLHCKCCKCRSSRFCGRPYGTGLFCFSDGEASLPVRKELQAGQTLTSAVAIR